MKGSTVRRNQLWRAAPPLQSVRFQRCGSWSAGHITPLAGRGLIKYGDRLAVLQVDKALVGRDPVWPGETCSHQLITPAFDHEPKQQNQTRYSEPQDYADIA